LPLKRSFLAVPSAHPTLLTKAKLIERRYEVVKILREYSKIIRRSFLIDGISRAAEERVTQLFVDVIPEIKKFVTSHLEAPADHLASGAS